MVNVTVKQAPKPLDPELVKRIQSKKLKPIKKAPVDLSIDEDDPKDKKGDSTGLMMSDKEVGSNPAGGTSIPYVLLKWMRDQIDSKYGVGKRNKMWDAENRAMVEAELVRCK